MSHESIHNLPLDSLELSNSAFVDARSKLRPTLVSATLAASLETLGQLTPVLLHARDDGRFDVIDGFRRARALADAGHKSVRAQVLLTSTPAARVMEATLACRLDELQGNVVGKVRFVRLARARGLSAATVVDHFLAPLDLQPHIQVLKRCEAIGALPEAVLDFCEVKSFSMKQCLHLTRHPGEVLDLVFSWGARLNLTASISEELAGTLSDLVRAADGPAAEAVARFAERPDIREILDSDVSVQQRTRELRDLLTQIRMPTLTGLNQKMRAARDAMGLPGHVRVSWDPSLERREVRVNAVIKDPDAWAALVDLLGEDKLATGVAAIMEEL